MQAPSFFPSFTTASYPAWLNELPEQCQKVKTYVEQKGTELFHYLKSDEGKKTIRLYVKLALSAIAGAYIGYIMGGKTGLYTGILIPTAFYSFTQCDREWFNFEKFGGQLLTLVKTIFASKILQGVVFAATMGYLFSSGLIKSDEDLQGQVVHQEIAQQFVDKGMQYLLYFSGAVVAPALEEVVYRGFLMDVAYSIQNFAAKKKWIADVNSTGQKTVRIALQAIRFGYDHYMPAQGLSNYIIVTQTGLLGGAFGYLMEKTSNIAIPFLYHSMQNFLAFYLMMNMGRK